MIHRQSVFDSISPVKSVNLGSILGNYSRRSSTKPVFLTESLIEHVHASLLVGHSCRPTPRQSDSRLPPPDIKAVLVPRRSNSELNESSETGIPSMLPKSVTSEDASAIGV